MDIAANHCDRQTLRNPYRADNRTSPILSKRYLRILCHANARTTFDTYGAPLPKRTCGRRSIWQPTVKPIAHDDPELPARSHESPSTTHQYLAADLAMKERALAALDSPRSAVPRFRPSDSPLAFLRGFESASAKRRQTCSHVTSGNKHWSRRADKWGCGPDNDFSANSTPPFPSLDRA
ncbi:MAG: hypothetical protein E6J65_26815 [Deltaproteobacteria bacterium]|nr:MAG: hypothetical protein E6J65_26815 [Deltaproteobacteria bacterium]